MEVTERKREFRDGEDSHMEVDGFGRVSSEKGFQRFH